jgi:hypothetical protein
MVGLGDATTSSLTIKFGKGSQKALRAVSKPAPYLGDKNLEKATSGVPVRF